MTQRSQRASVVGAVGTAGSRSYLRRKNSLAVLVTVWDHALPAATIANSTGISRTATEAVLSDLTELGWLEQQAPPSARTGLGRPASMYRLRPGVGAIGALDIGAHHITAMVTDLHGTPLTRVSHSLTEGLDARSRLDSAELAFRQALKEIAMKPSEVWALGVGSPGVIDQGVVTYFGGEGMPNWVGTDVAGELNGRLGIRTYVEGDSALGALAEQWRGAAADVQDVVYILSNQRTGAATVIGGRLHRGSHGGAGLVGELSALQWRDLEHETYGDGVFHPPRPSRAAIFAGARDGDESALAAVQDFAHILATGAAAMILAVDPDKLVLGGNSAQYADVLLGPFEECVAQLCPRPPLIVASSLGSDAVALGSVRHCLTKLQERLEDAVVEGSSFPPPVSTLLA